jgi:ubiquinone/menaquinone biosynthesis C-methylase UbiE
MNEQIKTMEVESTAVRERLDREAAFHDTSFSSDLRAEADKFYSITRTSKGRYHELIFNDVRGKSVLEYGCGTGSSAFDIARLGGHVTGIDISPVAIELAIRQAADEGVSERTRFLLMNAEELEFPDRSFDVICGSGILHHLDLEKSYSEIARVLKPGGVGVFFEPLGHNPLINWYRNRTPEMRTPDEHPLLMRDLEIAERYFSKVEVKYYHLFSLGVVPLRSTPLFTPLFKLTEMLDRAAMAVIPPLKKWAWISVMALRK